MAARPPHLPDALVRLLPGVLEEAEQASLERPRLLRHLQLVHAPLVHRVHDLAEDVELELLGRGVANAHRLRALVARQVVERELGQSPFSRHAVHDLDRGGVARGRTQEPRAPRAGLLEIARI